MKKMRVGVVVVILLVVVVISGLVFVRKSGWDFPNVFNLNHAMENYTVLTLQVEAAQGDVLAQYNLGLCYYCCVQKINNIRLKVFGGVGVPAHPLGRKP
ncbi:MAG: hypothetical protein Q4D98_00270 [Planctomycetia bacterium]|nr:hypothetical protein [Planctomycetia bacterium]